LVGWTHCTAFGEYYEQKRIERIAVFALAAFLVGYFIYQVAYGTNESSYKFGYQMGSLKAPQLAPGLNEN